ncbi:MAG: DUF3592 domain-containing protein [Verrucomicrobia bacterium]|nr:DUF3592 domain-containing protein [Verrucomicrobiota bacterium]
MKRPVVHDAVRLAFVALGVCCLLIAFGTLWSWRGWERAEGVVEVSPYVEFGRTNYFTQVAYLRDSGVRNFVFHTSIPTTARAGDHLPVLYDPERVKYAVVYCFDTVWSIPVYAGALGVALIAVGLFARGRRNIVSTDSRADAL